MMAPMRTIDPQQALTDAFEPGPFPAMGADGAPVLSPIADLGVDAPSLCAVGPCRHFHRFETRMDAADAMDGTRRFHVKAHRYCFPSPGIEADLGGEPVLACSSWVPVGLLNRLRARRLRAGYDRELAAWRAEHAPPLVPQDPVVSMKLLLSIVLADGHRASDVPCVVDGRRYDRWAYCDVQCDTDGAQSLIDAAWRALNVRYLPGGAAAGMQVTQSIHYDVVVLHGSEREPLENFTTPLAVLGITSATTFEITFNRKKETPA